MSWQVLNKIQSASSNEAAGTTKSPESEFKMVAVVLIQQDAAGKITNFACGLGPPMSHESDPATPGVYRWSVEVQKVPGVRALKRGRATGFSMVRRPNDTLEPWATTEIDVQR